MRRALAALAAMLIVLAPSLAYASCPCPCMRPAQGNAGGAPPHSCCGGAPSGTHSRDAPIDVPDDAPDDRCECSGAPTFTAERGVGFDPSLRATADTGPAASSATSAAPCAPAPSGLAGDSSHVPRCRSSATPASLPVLQI